MQKFITDPNFIYKYLLLELFEKLYRLSKYINTCKEFDKKNNHERIIELFESSIKIIGDDILPICSEIDSQITEDEKYAITIKISQNARAIGKIHQELKNLHSSWILPEIKTFTNEIISGNILSSTQINIILSDNYSFLERNLGKKFESILQDAYSKINQPKLLQENHSFILPKIEFSNPLNWTIIVHEAGHLQREFIEKIKNNPEILPDNIQSLKKDIIRNWAEEIFCDIYAASILGPAYFISFVSFTLLSSADYGISSFSEMHPSVIVRAHIILNYLKDNNLIFKPEWGIEDYTKLFYNCLISQNNVMKERAQEPIEGLTKFNRNLRKNIKALDLNKFQIEEEDSKRMKDLLDNLIDGIPIGSVVSQDSGTLLSLLKDPELSEKKLKDLKNEMSQRSSKIWEILNAGWIYKLEHSCKAGESIFFDTTSNSSDVNLMIHEYGKTIDFLDERLLSSINSSQIINVIEGRN